MSQHFLKVQNQSNFLLVMISNWHSSSFLEIWYCVHHHHHNVVLYGVQVIYFAIRNTPSRPICNAPRSSSSSTSSSSSAIKHILDSSNPLCKYSFSEFSAHPIGSTAHEYCLHCNQHPTSTLNTSSQDI